LLWGIVNLFSFRFGTLRHPEADAMIPISLIHNALYVFISRAQALKFELPISSHIRKVRARCVTVDQRVKEKIIKHIPAQWNASDTFRRFFSILRRGPLSMQPTSEMWIMKRGCFFWYYCLRIGVWFYLTRVLQRTERESEMKKKRDPIVLSLLSI
jgi:hypothetical protein